MIEKTRDIANVRIHVERLGVAKQKYQIYEKVIPISMLKKTASIMYRRLTR